MKRTMTAIAVALVAMIGAGQIAYADALDDIKKSGKIRIAVDLGVPPYGMTDDKMQPSGSDIETAKLLAKDWGLQFEHVPITGASRIPALQTGKPEMLVRDAAGKVKRVETDTAPAHNYVFGVDFQGNDIWVATAKGLSHGVLIQQEVTQSVTRRNDH